MNNFGFQKIKNIVPQWQEVITKKLRSRDIARKGQECMKKLRSMTLEDSSTDDDFKSDDCSALQYVGQSQNVSVEDFVETSALPNKELCSVPRKAPKNRVKFSEEEDAFHVMGIKKYGKGQWKQMLRDPELKFSYCRTLDTLIKRAIARKLIKKTLT